MSRLRWLVGSVALLTTVASPGSGQAGALLLFGGAGRQISVNDLSEQGDALRAGWSMGGGLGFQLGPHMALRGWLSTMRSSIRGPTLQASDSRIQRTFVAADLQVGIATSGGLAPYLFAGAGWARMDPRDPGLDAFSTFAGHFGTGVNYLMENLYTALFAEVGSWLYNFDKLGFDQFQYDLVLTAGLVFAIPL